MLEQLGQTNYLAIRWLKLGKGNLTHKQINRFFVCPGFWRCLGYPSAVSAPCSSELDEVFLGLSTSISLLHTHRTTYICLHVWKICPCLCLAQSMSGRWFMTRVVWLFPCLPLCFCDSPHSWCLFTPTLTGSTKTLFKSQLWLVCRMTMSPCPLNQPQNKKECSWGIRNTNLFLFCVHKQVFVDSLSGQRQTDHSFSTRLCGHSPLLWEHAQVSFPVNIELFIWSGTSLIGELNHPRNSLWPRLRHLHTLDAWEHTTFILLCISSGSLSDLPLICCSELGILWGRNMPGKDAAMLKWATYLPCGE